MPRSGFGSTKMNAPTRRMVACHLNEYWQQYNLCFWCQLKMGGLPATVQEKNTAFPERMRNRIICRAVCLLQIASID